MKGSVFVLLGCFAVFLAAPSRSYSISEDDRLANRRETQSGSRSTDAATSGDAGESEAVEMDGDANPGDESVARDARAEKSRLRKRDTGSPAVYGPDRQYTDVITTGPLIDKIAAIFVFRKLGKSAGKCFEKALDYIYERELPKVIQEFDPRTIFTRSDMIRWLEITKDSVSECLMADVDKFISESNWRDNYDRDWFEWPPEETFPSMADLYAPLVDLGKTLKKCLESAIRSLEEAWHGPGDTVQRSSESFSDLFTEMKEILSLMGGTAVPAGGTVPMFPPGHAAAPYRDSVPVITTYKKRNSPDKPRGYRHYSNLPGYARPRYTFSKGSPNSNAPQASGFRGGAVQMPYTPGVPAPPEYVNALATQQLSLLNVVLDKIYSTLREKVPPAVNMEVPPVEGLGGDANGALGIYRGDGGSPGMGNVKFVPECVH